MGQLSSTLQKYTTQGIGGQSHRPGSMSISTFRVSSNRDLSFFNLSTWKKNTTFKLTDKKYNTVKVFYFDIQSSLAVFTNITDILLHLDQVYYFVLVQSHFVRLF